MSDLNKYVGAQIQKRRKRAGLTLRNIADAVKTTPQTIQRLETDQMTLSMEWVDKIAIVLKCAPQELLMPFYEEGQFQRNCAEWPELPPRSAGRLKDVLLKLIASAEEAGELLAAHGDFSNEYYSDTIGACSELIARANALIKAEGKGEKKMTGIEKHFDADDTTAEEILKGLIPKRGPRATGFYCCGGSTKTKTVDDEEKENDESCND